MNHLCTIGPNADQPHHWEFPPSQIEDGEDLLAPKREVGTCRCCGVSRVHTNARAKGSNWATTYHAKRGAAARKARAL